MGLAKVDDDRWRRRPRWPCELCGAPGGWRGLCAGCHADLPWIGTACQRCARPLVGAAQCGHCARHSPPWSRAIAPLAWSFPVDALVSRFKYGGALHYGALLGRLLGETCRGRVPDGLVPVPLHRARLAERGFNQALELARPVATSVGVPILDDACQRIMATPPQAGLAARERHRNLRGAFSVSAHMVGGRRLAIIDDVMTTGSTARALCEELLRAGAAEVEVWAVARGGVAQAGENV